jgi:hypothetical protein
VEAFVHNSEIERHGDRRRVIGAGIKKLAVDHDRDGNDPRFAGTRNLHETQGARSLVNMFAPVLLCKTLSVEGRRPGTETQESERSSERKDDDAQPHAI